MPGILANTRGSTVVHLKWVQNRPGCHCDAARDRGAPKKSVETETPAILAIHNEMGGSTRETTQMHGYRRIAEVVEADAPSACFE